MELFRINLLLNVFIFGLGFKHNPKTKVHLVQFYHYPIVITSFYYYFDMDILLSENNLSLCLQKRGFI